MLNGVYTNGQWGTREIHSGDSVTYEEIMSSSMSFNLTVDPKLMSTPFVEIKVTSKDAHGGALGEDTIKAHFTPEMKVDANRDGKMSWIEGTDTDPDGLTQAIHNADQYATWTPYTFWLNDDNDSSNEDHPGSSQKDCSDNAIQSVRDLEDFTRLWISFRGMTDLVKSPGVTVRLEWLPESGTEWSAADGEPAIKIQKAVETDGGTAYLTDETTGSLQWGGGGLGGGGSGCLGEVRKGAPLELPASTFNGALGALNEQSPSLFALFEGSGEGKGRLRLTVRKNGVVLAQAGEIRLHIKNVKKMYQRAGATPDPINPLPYDSITSSFYEGSLNYTPDISPRFEKQDGEQQQCLVFVHGWRMSFNDSISFSETFFKRLWSQGYKGRFVAFRWATQTGAGSYNTSEWLAWKYGKSLRNYVENYIKHQMADYSIDIAAHSMGNVVAASALKRGMTVNRYILMEAAIPGGCYSDAVNNYGRFLDEEETNPTPDTVADLGYRLYMGDAQSNAVKRINFYNVDDFALFRGTTFPIGPTNWEANQISYKPNSFSTKTYAYDSGLPSAPYPEGRRCFLRNIYPPSYPGRAVLDIHESMSFVARPRSKAIGAEPNSGSVFTNSHNLQDYGFGDAQEDHSGQFNWSIQRAHDFYDAFYHELTN